MTGLCAKWTFILLKNKTKLFFNWFYTLSMWRFYFLHILAFSYCSCKIEGRRRRGQTEFEIVGWHHRLNGHKLASSGSLVMDRKAWRAAVHGVAKCWTWLRPNWTELNILPIVVFSVFINLRHPNKLDTTERLNWTELNKCIVAFHCDFNLHFLN